jgi:hypothetical protein
MKKKFFIVAAAVYVFAALLGAVQTTKSMLVAAVTGLHKKVTVEIKRTDYYLVNVPGRQILLFLSSTSKKIVEFTCSIRRSANKIPITAIAIFTATVAIAVVAIKFAVGPPVNFQILVAVCVVAIWTVVTVMKRFDVFSISGLTQSFATGFAGTGISGSFGHERTRVQQRTSSRMSGLSFFGHKVQHRTTGQTITVIHTDILTDTDDAITSSSSVSGADVSAKKGA